MFRRYIRAAVIVLFALLGGCATDDALRSQISQIEQRVTGLGQRVEQLSAVKAGGEHAVAAFAEKLGQAQQEQTKLGARLETLAREADQRSQDMRGLRVQIETTEKRVEHLQAQQKDSSDRLSRVELSAAQAALIGQQAATTAHLTASAAHTALQSIAEQASGALAKMSTKNPAVKGSADNAGATGAGGPSARPPDGDMTGATPAPAPQPARLASVKPGQPPRGGRVSAPPSTAAVSGPRDTPPGAGNDRPQADIATPTPQAQTLRASPAKGLRTIVPRTTPANPPEPEEAPPTANAETAYQLGLEAFSQRRYGEAIQRLEELRRLHPDNPLAVLSLYRLGEAHYAQRAYPLAAQAFQAFLAKHPAGAHVPDILLKLGLIAQATGNIPEAHQRFTTLTRDYPNSHEAAVARGILATIGQNTQ